MLAGWTKAKPPVVQAAYIPGSLSNFPLSINLAQADTDTRQKIAAGAKPDGTDLRFTLPDDTILSCYRRSYSVSGGLASGLFDVLVPSLTSGVDCSLLCQYGNPSASDVSNSAAVWGASGAGAALMMPDPSDGLDISGSGNNGTPTNVSQTTGQVGYGGTFTRTSSSVVTLTGVSLGTSHSAAAWVKPNGQTGQWNYGGIFGDGDTATSPLGVSGATDTDFVYTTGSGGVTYAGTSMTGLWHRLVSVRNGLSVTLYRDGQPVASGELPANDAALVKQIGHRNSSVLYYNGDIDEVVITTNRWSDSWAALDYNQIANQSSVVTWGAEQSTITPKRDKLFRRSFSRPFAVAFGG